MYYTLCEADNSSVVGVREHPTRASEEFSSCVLPGRKDPETASEGPTPATRSRRVGSPDASRGTVADEP